MESPPPRLTCTRRLTFDAGHRIARHESKCAHLHGHTYIVELTAERASSGLDDVGRVIDFSVLKAIVGSWIDRHLDHGFILAADDDDGLRAIRSLTVRGEPTKLFVTAEPPTAENLAAMILAKANSLLQDEAVRVVRVVVHETPNCFAEASVE